MTRLARGYDDYVQLARQYARQAGLPEDLFLAQIKQESNFDPTARSYADARGIGQIVPRWHPDVNPNMPGNQLPGVNPEWDLDYSSRLMASHLKKYGSYDRAASAYNSGKPDAYKDPNFSKGQTYNYVRAINAGRKQFRPGTPASQAAPVTRAPKGFDPQAQQPVDRKRQMLLSRLSSESDNPLLMTLLSNRMQGQEYPELQQAVEPGFVAAPRKAAELSGPWSEWVGKPERREGPSAPHTEGILQFVGQVGRIAGKKLTPWGNESHSLTTVNGNRSAHADGNAADIPATGNELVRLGQAALIAAGMDPAEANKIKGGLFNVGGYQIIFNTDEGGNHRDHLHTGLRG